MPRTFADLSQYQRQAAIARANQASPLDALLSGVQQGVQLQQLPTTIQNQQLEGQLRNALLLKQLKDAQNPQQAIADQIQKELIVKSALNPDLGIMQSEIPGAVIANPTAIPQTAVDLNAALAVNPAMAIPASAPKLPEVPIMPFGKDIGLSQNLNTPQAALQRKQDNTLEQALMRSMLVGQNQAIANQARADAADALLGKKQTFESGQTDKKLQSAKDIAEMKSKKGASGGMTPNQQASLMFKYGNVKDLVGPVDDPKLLKEDGSLDYNKLAIEVGGAERTQKLADLNAKEKALTSNQKKEIGGFLSAQKDLENLKAQVLQLDSKGEEPGVIQNAFASMASTPSTGFFSSLTRQFANSQLTEDTRKKEAVRSGLESAVTKSLSGTAVTPSESQRLTGLLPKSDDSLKVMITKLSGLEDFLNNRIEGTKEASNITSIPTASTPQSNPQSAPLKVQTQNTATSGILKSGNKFSLAK